MPTPTQNRIEKQITLKASPSRVWRALSDHKEFGQWFGVSIASPFEVGRKSSGRITTPGYQHIQWTVTVVAMEKERLFAFTWHPYAIDPDKNYEGEEPTRVEFRLEPHEGGTRLTVTEDGFDRIPAGRRAEAFRMNDGGWTAQIRNIAKHVDG